eukprot:977936_1
MAQAEEKKVEAQSTDSNSQGKIVIALGSGSYIKKKVVEDTFDSKATVIPLRFASGVPEQPVGKKQTMEGALFRANKAKELQPDASIYIGMENGMYREEPQNNDANNNKTTDIFDHWFDIGCIVIIYKNEKNELVEDVVWSDALPICGKKRFINQYFDCVMMCVLCLWNDSAACIAAIAIPRMYRI